MIFNEENIADVLDDAIYNEKIKVLYQPKYDAIQTNLSGAEALARWVDEDNSLIVPEDFIPLLEKTGDICTLDWFVLDKVCQFQYFLIKKNIPLVTISSNFSRKHIEEPDFIKKFCKIVDRYQIPHKYIEAEITESALAGGTSEIIEFVKSIRENGFNVAIDDFGSGLSSLSFVKDVPANVLKLDKSLLSGNCESEKERIVLESIFQFAHRLNMQTITEGVETNEQLGFLKTCDCNQIQGFLFSKPIEEDQFLTLCAEPRDIEKTDILTCHSNTTSASLLIDAVFQCYPLTIMINLSRDSYYMMASEHFTTKSCPTTGIFHECIYQASKTMVEEDQQKFINAFDRDLQMAHFLQSDEPISAVCHQIGDDGVVRAIITTNYKVTNHANNDILVISLSRLLDRIEKK